MRPDIIPLQQYVKTRLGEPHQCLSVIHSVDGVALQMIELPLVQPERFRVLYFSSMNCHPKHLAR